MRCEVYFHVKNNDNNNNRLSFKFSTKCFALWIPLWIIVHWFYEMHSTELDHPKGRGHKLHLCPEDLRFEKGRICIFLQPHCSFYAAALELSALSCFLSLICLRLWIPTLSPLFSLFFSPIIQPCPQRIKGLEIVTQIEETVPDIETERLIDIMHHHSK